MGPFITTMAPCQLILALLLLLMLATNEAQGQPLLGLDICGCQPAAYTMEFDFGLVCDDGSIDDNRGVNETACLTAVRDRATLPGDSLVPLAVQNVQIFELDQSLQVVSQTVKPGSFMDGDSFTYTSILQTSGIDSSAALPRGLQIVTTGVNEEEESVVNTFIVTYTNDCGVFPVLEEGQTAGWITFVSSLLSGFVSGSDLDVGVRMYTH